MSNTPSTPRTIRLTHDSLLTRHELAELLDVKPLTVFRWEADKKIQPVSRNGLGGPLFAFKHLAVALREIIALGVVPTLSKRKKRGC